MPPQITIAFDLYGTLLSTSSISQKLSSLLSIPSQKAEEIATLWRRYQLEYTWRSNSMQKYIPFDEITLRSLHHALKESHIPIPNGNGSEKEEFDTAIMQSYNELHTFPDAADALTYLSSQSSQSPKLSQHIFSNGTPSMLQSSFQSPHLQPYTSLFSNPSTSIISVDPIQTYKPATQVYQHLATTIGKPIGEIWLVSGNPFDIVGAKNAGMKTCWINRASDDGSGGGGWVDCLGDGDDGEGMRPDLIANGVDAAVGGIEEREMR